MMITNGTKLGRYEIRSKIGAGGIGEVYLALEKDTPESRAIQPPVLGTVIELPQVGGLQHRYERRTA